MSERLKMTLQIVGFILVIALLGWAIWAVFFRTPGASIIPGGEAELQVTGLPDISEGPSGRVVEEEGPGRPSTLVPEPETEPAGPDRVAAGGRTLVQAITRTRAEFNSLSNSGNFNYYNSSDERFYTVGPDGKSILLSDEVFRSVDSVAWSHEGDSAVIEFPDGANIYYNFETGERATLPRQAKEFSFSPEDSQLAYEYIGEAEDDRYIVTSSANGQGRALIEPLGRESHNVKVDWSPNSQVVATYREPTSSQGEEVFFIGFNDENFLSLQTNGIGFEGMWSPTSKQVLYSVYSDSTNYTPVLHIAGAQGDNIGLGNRALRIQTWPDKCTFESEEIVYCAVPQFLDEGAGIFREMTNSVPDTIYKIDLINNISSVIAFPESESRSSFTIESMDVSEDGRELYFTDRVTGKIHKMQLR
jgi:WD40 repeat protein